MKDEIFNELLNRASVNNPQLASVMLQVKENNAKLDACGYPHDFQPTESKLGSKHVCTKCGGEVTGQIVYWYEKGLTHGQWVLIDGDPDETKQ